MAVHRKTPRNSNSPIVIESQSEDEPDDITRSVTAVCKRCGKDVAEMYNAFIQITGSYFMPAMPGSYSITSLDRKGKSKRAQEGTELDGW